MKLSHISKTSLVLLVIQLALISTVAAKYLYQRFACPRVWTRTVVYDPELLMRGRYLSLQLVVDGCQSTLPSAKMATFPRYIDGTTRPDGYTLRSPQAIQFRADLKVENNRLLAIRIQNPSNSDAGVRVDALPGTSCQEMHLDAPSDFYISEHAASPTPIKPGQELWVEVTIPKQGPPRPIQLALKEGSGWKPLAFQ